MEKTETERMRMDAFISSYYDSLSDEDREQNRAWGSFAEAQISEGLDRSRITSTRACIRDQIPSDIQDSPPFGGRLL